MGAVFRLGSTAGFRQIARNASVRLAVGTAALTLSPAIGGVLAARTLGAEGRGELAILLAMSSVAGTVGLRGRDVSFLAGAPIDRLATLLRRAGAVAAVEGTVAALVVWRVLDVASSVALGAVIVQAAATCLFMLIRAANLASARSSAVLAGDLAAALLGIVAAAVAAAGRLPASWYVVGSAVGLLVGALVSGTALKGHQDQSGRQFQDPAGASARRYAWFARAMQGAAFRLDRVVLAVFAGSSTAGLYAAAVPLAEMATILPLHLAQLATVRAATAPQGMAWYQHRDARMTIAAAAALSAMVCIAAPAILDVVYGSDFEEAAGALRVLAIASAASVVWRFAEAELFGRSITRPPAIATAIAAIVVLGLTAMLSGLGPVAAAWGSLAGYTVGAIIVMHAGRRYRCDA